MAVDYTYRLRIEHRPGQLARVMESIAEAGGLVGEVRTCKLMRRLSVRELTVVVEDGGAGRELSDRLDAIDSVEVEHAFDRALAAHEGGKLTIEPVRPVEGVQDMRDVYTPGVARACEAIRDDPDAARRVAEAVRQAAAER